VSAGQYDMVRDGTGMMIKLLGCGRLLA
jgi:hypothetical protein